jgi:glycosyltransferase involved in cell wall biosynthesis
LTTILEKSTKDKMIINNNPLISIVIPCYNEEGNIEVLYEKIKKAFPSEKLEYIFVDDNSNDNTLAIIERLTEKDNYVKYVSFSRNFGHQNALRAGLEYSSGDCVISMDADLQHPPEMLQSLVDKWKEGYEVVYTIRKDIANVSAFKRITSALFYKLMNNLSEVEIKQGSADFRLLDRKVVDVLVHDITEYHLFYRGLISWIGYKQIGIEYVPDKRFSGKTKYPFNKMLSFAANGITSFSIKPLKFAILLGTFISFISVLYALYVLYMALFTDKAVEGWSSVILSVLFIGGIHMILLGIIGEYIGKLYIQSKKRPYFLIKKTNFENG